MLFLSRKKSCLQKSSFRLSVVFIKLRISKKTLSDFIISYLGSFQHGLLERVLSKLIIMQLHRKGDTPNAIVRFLKCQSD